MSSRSSESSWGTSPIRARMRGPSLAGSIPSTLSVPPLSGLMHEIIRMVDVLPAPFGPEEPERLALGDAEVDPVDGDEIAEALDQPVRLHHRARPRRRRPRPPRRLRIGGVSQSARNVTSLSGNDTVPLTSPTQAGGRADGWERTGAGVPAGFTWGTATAAHQIEGGNSNNDWWAFEHTPGSGCAEPSGDCCDSWNRWEEDADLVAALGLRQLPLLGGVEPH